MPYVGWVGKPDSNPGWNSYRLKATDLNGMTIFSGIETIWFSGQSESLRVRPNPFSAGFNLNVNSEKASLLLFNISGEPVLSYETRQVEENVYLQPEEIPMGIYFLKITRIGMTPEVIRLVKL